MKYFIIILSACNSAKILNGLNGKFSERAYPSQENALKGCNKVSSGGSDNNFIFVSYNKNKIILFVQQPLHGLFNFHYGSNFHTNYEILSIFDTETSSSNLHALDICLIIAKLGRDTYLLHSRSIAT